MNNLKVKYFKAYQEEISIDFTNDKKSLLLYGENGSGKSSLYEAIKIIFFREKLEELIPEALTPEEDESKRKEFWNQYDNNSSSNDFEININNESYSSFDTSNYQVFMIAMDKFCFQDKIRLDELLKNFDLSIDDIDSLCTNHYETIQNNINDKLREFKEDNIKITIDNEDDFSIIIKDTVRGLDYKDNLSQYFNEAKLNLVVLLLLFESIVLSEQTDKKKILVLDDFITSLDMANRTFLMNYIFENFEDCQKIILTHNVYFYNLIMYLVNDIYKEKSKWLFANLYEINNQHKLYIKGKLTVKSIKDRYNESSTLSTSQIESIGNDIRKRFEQLLHELSKLFMIGAVEESKKIIENIEKTKTIYLKNKKTALDLLDEIEKIIEEDYSKNRIKSKISQYKFSELSNFQTIIRELKLYQKVTMHPMSHSSNGLSSFTQKEIEASLALLEKLERSIKDLVGSDVNGA